MKFDTINQARLILELPENATMELVRENYRTLIKRWHPDRCKDNPEKCEEMSRRITDAYGIILEYCSNYHISFAREEVEKNLSEEEFWIKRFGSDPIWGI